jgi:hypothetical protein
MRNSWERGSRGDGRIAWRKVGFLLCARECIHQNVFVEAGETGPVNYQAIALLDSAGVSKPIWFSRR